MRKDVFVGVDLGTGGVRVLAVDASGSVVAAHSVAFPPSAPVDGRHEQDPESWWTAACQACRGMVAELSRCDVELQRLAAVAVDGTSGTIALLDPAGAPVAPGLMYNDARSTAEAARLNELAAGFCERLGYRFNASFALAKIEWLRCNEPDRFRAARYIVHQADFVAGRLSECLGVSDYSNALKTGYDLLREVWPDWIGELPGVCERLPAVRAPGEKIGEVTAEAAAATGLPSSLPVIAGASDGTAGCLASGIRQPGDLNSSLGTTLVFKAVSSSPAKDPDGLIYSHKLPGGLWLPGAASNVGAEWITQWFPGADLQAMDAAAAGLLPCDAVAYPLARRGERFPFLAPDAAAVGVPDRDETLRDAACLQGTALLERLAFETLEGVSGHPGSDVYTTGGASRSDIWTQLRADVTRRRYHRPVCPETAFGSAVLAASGVTGWSVRQATAALVRIDRIFDPDSDDKYAEIFAAFRQVVDVYT
ncbi:MAG: FGGY-family carbohydrate kinase [Lentisphaeria bacterium]|nr:FGGY-family carbohydrate kinase [Lentisphaeria bacterium]